MSIGTFFVTTVTVALFAMFFESTRRKKVITNKAEAVNIYNFFSILLPPYYLLLRSMINFSNINKIFYLKVKR
jgi:hypothetical protein